MAATTAFLDSCRTAILLTSELTAFRAAYANFDTAATSEKLAYWRLVYSDAQAGMSPAYRLRKAIREIVLALATPSVTELDREGAYSTLASEYVPSVAEPQPAAVEAAALQALLVQELLS